MLTYQLFTLPDCPRCAEFKKLLAEKTIEYEEISLSDSEGKKRLGKVYLKIADKLKRDEKGMSKLPLLIRREGADVQAMAQEVGDLEGVLA